MKAKDAHSIRSLALNPIEVLITRGQSPYPTESKKTPVTPSRRHSVYHPVGRWAVVGRSVGDH